MNRFLKWVLWGMVVITVGVFIYAFANDSNLIFPKKSPEDTVSFIKNDLDLEVFYNRPSKRGREIFGGLVPYKQVWRTGANEATTFETNKPLKIVNDSLPAGKYTLWTIPSDSTWHVMFNRKSYPWGVDASMKPMREAQYDVVDVEVPVEQIDTQVEQFTIGFDNSLDKLSLTMVWDDIKVAVPLNTYN